MSQSGIISIENVNPDIPLEFDADSGSAMAVANTINVFGGAGIATSAAGNTITIALTGGGAGIDSVALDGGTTPIEADALGLITHTGLLTVAGTNPIITYGTGANSYQTRVQLSQAIPSADSTKVGLSNFNSNQFTVDSDGYVSLVGQVLAIDSVAVQTGTSPVVPNAAGLLTINGAVVAAGTNPVRSDGTDANTLAIEVQVASAITGAPGDKNNAGIASFNDVFHDVDADGYVSPTTNWEQTSMHGWNGSIVESASVVVSSDGAVITLSVEKNGGGDLTVVFSDPDLYYVWDTTPADTVTLTAGTDTVPVLNYVYFLNSTKTLTASTSSWPATEHAPIATVLCQTAASIVTDGPYKVHAWTDHVVASDKQGHIGDINFWIRQQAATWVSGVTQTYTITPNGGSADNVVLTTTSGVVLQLHTHTFPAFSGTPDYYVVNDFVTPYLKVTDLNALLTDSTGATMSGRYFSLVIWGCVSEETGDCKLFVNLPGGSYNNSSGLLDDIDAYSNYTIPSLFKGTGFLISEWKLRHQAAASGTWTSIDEISLLGLFPSLSAGGFPGSIAFTTDSGVATPASNNINILGAVVAAGTSPFATSGTGSTVTSNVQISQAIASTDATKIGLANFNSAHFSVDANGFVELAGGQPINTINGDSGSITGSTVTIYANQASTNAGSSVKFVNSGTTSTFNVTDTGLNTLIGSLAGNSSLTGQFNTSLGYGTLRALTSGANNVALGINSMINVQTGFQNVAVGYNSMGSGAATSSGNVALGVNCMINLTSGGNNVGVGSCMGAGTITNTNNVAVGHVSLNALSSGTGNTAVGQNALNDMSTGDYNTAIGINALETISSGTWNTALGINSGQSNTTTDSHNIYIRNVGASGESNTIRIGTQGNGNGEQDTCFVAGIAGVTVSNQANVVIDTTTGQLAEGAATGTYAWIDTSGAFSPLKGNGYFITATATGTLPASPTQGDTIQFFVDTTDILTIQTAGTQTIRMGTLITSGGGTAVSTQRGDSCELVYRASNDSWQCVDMIGTWVIS